MKQNVLYFYLSHSQFISCAQGKRHSMWVGWHSELPCCRESLVVIYERFLLTFTMPIVQVESSYSGNLFQIPMVAIRISKQLMHWWLCSVSNDLEICRHCSTNPSLVSSIDRIQNICQDAWVLTTVQVFPFLWLDLFMEP